MLVADAVELDVSSCGGTGAKAVKNLKEAVRLFLEEAENMQILSRVPSREGAGQRPVRWFQPAFLLGRDPADRFSCKA